MICFLSNNSKTGHDIFVFKTFQLKNSHPVYEVVPKFEIITN